MIKWFFSSLLLLLISSCSLMPGLKQNAQSSKTFSQHVSNGIIKPANDQREYRSLRLDNGLEVLLISDKQARQAAAALDVFVGSGADPKKHQGLAHFLEHMLFLGTKKYPEADEYQSFLAANGGKHNAYTSFEHTNYFFSVNAGQLEPALDRFAQFFIEPLLTPAYVERERNAVNSEYSARIKNELRRSLDAYKAVIRQDHALANFSVGNLKTLSDASAAEEGGIRQVLLNFYRQYYHAGMMRLVVLGSDDLNQLEQMVKQKFSAIRAGERTLLDFSGEVFEPGQLPALLTVKPEKDLKTLMLNFALDDVMPHWREKPLQYIGHLLGHEGEGSLLAYLKQQNLASGISAGLSNSYQGGASFGIKISLTDKGVKHWQNVVDACFAAIKRLRQQAPKRWIYQELAQLGELEFKFLENAAPIHTVSQLANRLQLYPPEQVLAGPYWYQNFQSDLISFYLDQLKVDDVLITLIAKEVTTDKVSPYFHAPYQFTSLSKSQKQRWQLLPLIEAITLPQPNPFLLDDVAALEPGERKESLQQAPRLLQKTERLSVWRADDKQFGLPKTNIYLNARYSEGQRAVKTSVLLPLYTALLNEQLKQHSYLAELAGLQMSLRSHSRGISLRMGGFDGKLPVVLEHVLQAFSDLNVSSKDFERLQQAQLRALSNTLLAGPAQRLQQGLAEHLLQPSWSIEARIKALEALTLDEVKRFSEHYWSQVRWDMLVHGRMPLEQVDSIIAKQLEPFISRYSKPLEPQQPLCLRNLNDDTVHLGIPAQHTDHALLLYWQGDELSYAEWARLQLAAKIMQPLYFHQLRTKQQLGYIVYATPYNLFDVPGLAFIVQSPAADTKALFTAQKTFMHELQQETIRVEDFKQHQQALVTELNIPFKTLTQATESYWQAIALSREGFDHKARLAQAVQALDYQDWQQWLQRRLAGSGGQFWLSNDASRLLPGQNFAEEGFNKLYCLP